MKERRELVNQADVCRRACQGSAKAEPGAYSNRRVAGERDPGGAGMAVGHQVREVLWSQVRRGLEGCFEGDFSRGVEPPDAHFERAILTSELRRC